MESLTVARFLNHQISIETRASDQEIFPTQRKKALSGLSRIQKEPKIETMKASIAQPLLAHLIA